MDKPNFVSVWIGNVDSEKTLSQLTEYRTTMDGDFVACAFCKALGINDYEPENLEWKFFPKKIEHIRILLHAFSYSDIMIPKLEQHLDGQANANCCIALYNIQFDGDQTSIEIAEAQFQFLGHVTYCDDDR